MNFPKPAALQLSKLHESTPSPRSTRLACTCHVNQMLEILLQAHVTPCVWNKPPLPVHSLLVSKCVNSSFSLWFLLKKQINHGYFAGMAG